MTRRDVIELVLAALVGGVMLGYTLGLIQQAVWKEKNAKRNNSNIEYGGCYSGLQP